MTRFLTIPIFLSLLAQAPAQSLNDYLKLRNAAHIDQPLGPSALTSFTGTKTVEIECAICGTFRSGEKTTLVVALTSGEQQTVEAKAAPEWLLSGDMRVRMLVKVSRPDSLSPLAMSFLAAARNEEVRSVEEAYWAKEAAKRQSALTAKANAAAAPKAPVKAKNPIAQRSPLSSRSWVLPTYRLVPPYASFIKGRNRKLSMSECTRIAQAVIAFSIHYQIDARLVMAILIVESDFDPNSTSHSGAMGLGQLMPDTAKWMGVSNAYDTTDNLYGSIKLLNLHLRQYYAATGDPQRALELALAAYNAGEGAVRRHGGIPPYAETQRYVRKVITIYNQLTAM